MIYIIEMIGCVTSILFLQYGFNESKVKKTKKQKTIGLLGAICSFTLMILVFVIIYQF